MFYIIISKKTFYLIGYDFLFLEFNAWLEVFDSFLCFAAAVVQIPPTPTNSLQSSSNFPIVQSPPSPHQGQRFFGICVADNTEKVVAVLKRLCCNYLKYYFNYILNFDEISRQELKKIVVYCVSLI